MKKYVLAIDQGTTSSRVILFDKENNIIASSQLEVGIICEHSGWVEQNALEIAQKKDSQEICFIPDNDYQAFLKKYSTQKSEDPP